MSTETAAANSPERFPIQETIAAAASTRKGSVALRRVVINSTSLLTSDVLNRAATFAVYAMVARYCGATSFGQLSLGLMLLYTFQVLAGAGLPTLIMREVAKKPEASGRYFANANALAACMSLVSIGALYLFTLASRYPHDTSEIVLLLGVSVLPCSLTAIAESVLRAWEQMHWIILIAIPVNSVKIGLSYYLLATGHDVRAVALVFLGCNCATVAIEWPLVLRQIQFRDALPNLGFARDLFSRTWRFLGIEGLIAVWGSINTVLLSWFAGETAVGLFAAAWQLLVPVTLIFQAVANGLFPLMCRHAEGCRTRIRQLTILLLEILMMFIVPGSVLLYFGAGPIVQFVYGNEDFSSSVTVLRITLPVLILQAVCTTFGQVLFSQNREHVTLRITAADVVCSAICSTVLISNFGLFGAALSLLLTWLLNAVLHFAAVRECLLDENGEDIPWNSTLIWSIAMAGLIMAGALAMTSQLNFILASILTSLLYVIVLGSFVHAACAGSLGFRERFLMPLGEH